MRSRFALMLLLCLLAMMSLPRPSRGQDSTLFCFPKDEAQRLYRDTSENSLLKEKITVLEEADRVNKQQIANLEQQVEIQKKLIDIAERRAGVEHIAYGPQNALTDHALNIAEIGKPKSNWQMQGIIGLAAFVLGFVTAK